MNADDDLYRIGQGDDLHRLVEGRSLILGGVKIPFEKGLLGHSDADVLAHAAANAVLGAAGLGDIGRHFPDDDPRFQGADSLELLRQAAGLAAERGFAVINVDCTIIAGAPKIAPYARHMEDNLAMALGTPADRVNVKATSNEGLGPEGRGEAISARATALLRRFRQEKGGAP